MSLVCSRLQNDELKKPFDPLDVIDEVPFEEAKHESRLVMKRLIAVTCVSCIFMACEFLGGWLSNSLAILTDAAHLLSDVAGFLISIFSIWVSLVPAKKESFSYGYHRAQIIGALASVLIIWALTGWLVIEAIHRVMKPSGIDGKIMVITACIGLTCNLFMGIILNTNICGRLEIKTRSTKFSTEKNPNLKAAIVHILGDTLQSLGVIIASLVIYTNPDAIIADPIMTFIFSIIVLATTIGVASECIRCMMEASPKDFNILELEESLLNLPEAKDLHDLHVWSLTTGKMSLSAHMRSTDPTTTLIAADKLLPLFGIYHSTIQMESWDDKEQLNCRHLFINLIHE